ncbi:MAG: DUF1643 domain-containing protein [Salinibacterium sp.]|nr:MAG: DUF1643 domain-containing protein [Salinibacterium sp.]
MTLDAMEKGAEVSPCERFRYRLWRRWDAGREAAVWLMLNPSTADHARNDPTIRRVLGFSTAWGFGSAEVVNLFAIRSKKPAAIHAAADPIGPLNDAAIVQAVTGRRVVLAWGAHGTRHADRVQTVLRMLAQVTDPDKLMCLGRTVDGEPLHPLMLKAATPLVPWRTA